MKKDPKMCIECGHEVGGEYGRCPHCGKILWKKSIIGWAFVILLILLFFWINGWMGPRF